MSIGAMINDYCVTLFCTELKSNQRQDKIYNTVNFSQ